MTCGPRRIASCRVPTSEHNVGEVGALISRTPRIIAAASVVLGAAMVLLSIRVVAAMGDETLGVFLLIAAFSCSSGLAGFVDLGSLDYISTDSDLKREFGVPLEVIKTQRIRVFAASLLYSALVVALAGPGPLFDGERFQTLIVIFLLSEVLIESQTSIARGILERQERFVISRMIDLLGRATQFAVLIVVAVWHLDGNHGSLWMAASFPASSVVKTVLLTGLARRRNESNSDTFRGAKQESSTDSLFRKLITQQSNWRHFATLRALGAVHGSFARIILGVVLGVEALVSYEIGARLYSLVQVGVLAMSTTLLPTFRRLLDVSDSSEVALRLRSANLLFVNAVFMLVLGLLAIAPIVSKIIYGVFPVDSRLVLVCLLGASVISAVNHLGVIALQASGEVGLVRRVQGPALLFNLMLGSLLGVLLGAVGAAFGALLSAVAVWAVYRRLIRRIPGFNPRVSCDGIDYGRRGSASGLVLEFGGASGIALLILVLGAAFLMLSGVASPVASGIIPTLGSIIVLLVYGHNYRAHLASVGFI